MGKRDDPAATAANEQLVQAVRTVCDSRLSDPKRRERQMLKEQINGPINFLLGNAIGKDDTYSQQMGMISRSYRGSGAFPNTDFDMHLPLADPPGARLEFEPHKLPFCNIGMKSPPKAWADNLQNGRLSAARVRESLRKRIAQCVDEWNQANKEHGTMSLRDGRANQPICLTFVPAASDQDPSPSPVGVSITPVIFAKDISGSEQLFTKAASDKSWKWPPEMELRKHLAEQAVLLPRGDMWDASMMVAHKLMVGELDDKGNTFREMLYRALKTASRKIIAPAGADYQESVKVASFALLQVYLNELGRHPDPAEWSDPKMVPDRLKSVLAEWRNVLASAELTEAGSPGRAANTLAAYKGSSYLNPTLGKLVKNLEALQKNPQSIEKAAK